MTLNANQNPPITPLLGSLSNQKDVLPHLQRENITMRIYKELRVRIMAGQFRPGEILTLRSVSESMGVSQTPVREALLQLASERVLSVSPGRSVRIPELSRKEILEFGMIRTTLECLAARHAATHQSPELIERLTQIHAELIALKRTGDVTGLLDRNLQFHFTLYTASNLPTLVATIEGFWARTGPFVRYLYRNNPSNLPGPHPHNEIIEALTRNDVNGVETALRRDIEENWKILIDNAFDGDRLRKH